ncbi:tRNA-dihydrouridine synthase [Geobacter sp. DSM 9736]|uniref:tRNA dihydrouridine synthase n=1 Tax=Geobacter sp. DSM 9736 TaxID=1277350 RepID=UPI000B5FCBEE|nr:tRNA-dihydrouridine synthase family protein [Geobacter sp. DSM 9736]SNB47380.1 tRNA-U20a,U20b-dihydrouridine synthase [Geobacter sp. DSM 9736]
MKCPNIPNQPSSLPWPTGSTPLMLAPMQGLTNRALRAHFIEQVRPDVVFTEFMRVNAAAEVKRLSVVDLRGIAAAEEGVPLVVQLVGHGREPLVSAAREVQGAGAAHINLNMGCPYGRMTTGLTGGGMLRKPEELAGIICPLRDAVRGTFSVKLRAGYDDPELVLELLPLFEAAGVDFLVLHPRTVVQKYTGCADHTVTDRVVRETRLPVIANGDIRTAAYGEQVLRETGAAGLMLGRGAIADPLLFHRLRGNAPAVPGLAEQRTELRRYLQAMLVRYGRLFCGGMQVLAKLKEITSHIDTPELAKPLKELRRAKTLEAFEAALALLD